jgi:signal transduction histidine kinase
VTEDVQALRQRIVLVTAARLAFLTFMLVTLAFFSFRGELQRYPDTMRIVFATLASGYVAASIYAALLRRMRALGAIVYGQIVVDQLTWTVVVWITGGPTSFATSFYSLTCLIAAILLGWRGAAVSTVLGLALYWALCGGLISGWLAPPHDQPLAHLDLAATDLSYAVLANTLGIAAVAALGGYLAERLRITGSALEEARQRALVAERQAVLGRVAAGLAHEIRNPLGSIRGAIEMLHESPDLGEEEKHLCLIVEREALRLNELVGDMIDLAKPRPPKAEAVDVARLAREVVELAARSEASNEVRVVYDGPTHAVRARCDGGQMRQVLWNLLRNALQASPPGSTVEIAVSEAMSRVELAVKDEGPGVSADDVAKMFDAFFTTRSQGLGVGLAVVKRIIDDHAAMGCELTIENRPDHGAQFVVSLNADISGLKHTVPPPRLR